MAEIKTREKSKGIKALDKAVVAGERMKRAFVRSKDQAENLLDDGQISPSEYAEDKVRYMAEDTAREVGHESGKLTGKAKSACRSHREAKRTADAAQQDRTRIRHARSQTIKTAEARQRTVKQTAKSTGQATVKTAKGTVKTAQKSAKTAQQTSKAAIKTAEATAKATKAAAQTSAKAARTTAQAAKTAAQTLVAAAKAAAKAIASAAKAIAAAVKALVAAIAAGGWVALIVIVIICLIAAVVACFGIFFSSEDTGSDKPMRTVVQEINQEYQAQLDDIKGSVVYDTLEMSGSRAVWPEVLSVYAVKVTSDPDNPQEVATVTPEKEQILRDIFWAMNTISHSTTTESVTTIIESDDGHGNILLSRAEANDILAWEKLAQYKEEKTVLDVKVKGIVNAGVIAYVEGIRGFIPASKLSLNYVEDLNEYLNKDIQVQVFDLDKEKDRLILSAREILREKADEERKEKISNVEVGLVTEGTVESLQPYGAFISLGNGLSGLVHISQICAKRIKHPSAVLAVGDKVKVKVIAIKDGKLSLSMKALDDVAAEEIQEETIELPETEEVTTTLGSLFKNIKLN